MSRWAFTCGPPRQLVVGTRDPDVRRHGGEGALGTAVLGGAVGGARVQLQRLVRQAGGEGAQSVCRPAAEGSAARQYKQMDVSWTPTSCLTCHKPPVVPPRPPGHVSCRGAADTSGMRCWLAQRRSQTPPHLKSVSCSVVPTTNGTSLCSLFCSQTSKGGASSTYPSTATTGPTKCPLSGRSVRSAAAQDGYSSQGMAWPKRLRYG